MHDFFEFLPKGMHTNLSSNLSTLPIEMFQPINIRFCFWLVKRLDRWIFKIAWIHCLAWDTRTRIGWPGNETVIESLRLWVAFLPKTNWKIKIDIDPATKMIIVSSILSPHSINVVTILIAIGVQTFSATIISVFSSLFSRYNTGYVCLKAILRITYQLKSLKSWTISDFVYGSSVKSSVSPDSRSAG